MSRLLAVWRRCSILRFGRETCRWITVVGAGTGVEARVRDVFVAHLGIENDNRGRWLPIVAARPPPGRDGCVGDWRLVGTLNFNRMEGAVGEVDSFTLLARTCAVVGV